MAVIAKLRAVTRKTTIAINSICRNSIEPEGEGLLDMTVLYYRLG